jgi:Ca-activated chloride channel homolog
MKHASGIIVRIGLALAAIGLLVATAQEPPPTLLVKQGDAYEEMSLSRLDVDVRIHGFLAETTSTMTFHNPHDRVLEGDMYFPLPQGATVNGYALDIKGQLVDGVAVEKARARAIFEKVVRQGIDPGLMEWTRGNNFKTRIFPIPAKGERTIRVRYITEIQGGAGRPAAFRLPLNIRGSVAQFDLRVEVVRAETTPTITSGAPEGFEFKTWRSSYVAEAHQKEAELKEDLVIALPDTERAQVLVEKAADGSTYFCIHDFPAIPEAKREETAPRRLAVYWDASGSRAGRDHAREVDVLDQCLAHWSALADEPIQLELTLLRNQAGKGLTLPIGKKTWKNSAEQKQLLQFLRDLAYDGGTDLGGLLQAGAPDRVLLFTDGLPTFGEAALQPKQTLYVFCDDASADHVFMSSLAEGSGGRYFNLKQVTDRDVLNGLHLDEFAYRGATAPDGGAKDLYPQRAQPVVMRQTVVGKLTADQSEIVLSYGSVENQTTQTIKVSREAAVEGELLRRTWAQTKLNDLLAFQKQHRAAIIDIGKAHALVTPFTSLLVLDSLEQYVEHRVTPPRSLPKLRDAYAERMEQIEVAEKKTRADKLAKVLPMWNNFYAWWGTNFTYAKNFRYREKSVAKRAAGGAEPVAPSAAIPRPALMAGRALLSAESEDAFAEVADFALSGEVANEKASKSGTEQRIQPGVVLTPWDPKTPYLAELKKAKPAEAYARYLALRKDYPASPAFFLDCADFFRNAGQQARALQVLSNIAELELENPQLLRVLAHRLEQTGELSPAILIFDQVLDMRPEEPQSYRDLALALIARAEARTDDAAVRADYARAIDLLVEIVMRHWDRFEEIEIMALVELNRIIPTARKLGITDIALDKRLIKEVDCDMRITMTWDADITDIDLHVIEPSSEEAFYGHNRTTIGGRVSRDFTQGYGPEEYMLRKAMNGTYTVKAKYYGSQSVKLLGGVTVQVNIFTHYGRPEQQCKSITVRLVDREDMITIGELEF